MTTKRNVISAVFFIVGGFIFGNIVWAKMYPSDYNEWVQESGAPLPLVWEPTVRLLPTAIVATMYPVPTATAAPTPTPMLTPMQCTPDDAYYHTIALEQLQDARQVQLLALGWTYSIWLIEDTEEQACTGIGERDLRIIYHDLQNEGTSSTFESVADVIGNDIVGRVGTFYWRSDDEVYIFEEPIVVGPNDEIVKSAWSEQIAKINEVAHRWYKEDLVDVDLVDFYSQRGPASECWVMGMLEAFVPLPEEVFFCRQTYPAITYDYVGEFMDDTYFGGQRVGSGLMIFYEPPETQFDGDIPLKFFASGSMVVGQKMLGHEVIQACIPIRTGYQSRLVDPVVLIFDTGPGLVVPRGAWIGVGTWDGKGYEQLYKVCP